MSELEDKDLNRFDEMLSRYMKGQLSEGEEVEFKQLIADDPELRNKAIATARIVKAMNDVGCERDDKTIEEIRQTTEKEIKIVASNVSGAAIKKLRILNFRKLIVSFSVAASILLCVFGGYKYYKYEQVSSLGSEYLAYFPASEFSRGENDGVSDILKELYSDIETKHNLGDAIARLSGMWTESRGDTFNDYTEYMPEIGWMLANAYLRDNDKSKALEVLGILIAESPEGTAMGDKARERKEKVEKL